MPTYSRRQIVVDGEVGVYHCVARCVRRAFLCGVDKYTGQDFSHRHDLAMLANNSERLAQLRERLSNLSWFMRCLCEKIARTANHEDGSSGRFWAGRFQIQAGGGATELARRCRSAALPALVPGQGGCSNRLCVGHRLDAEP